MTGRATAPVAVVLATLSVTMLCGCGRAAKDSSASAKTAAQAPPPEVTVAAFQTRLLPEYLEVTGRIEAVRASSGPLPPGTLRRRRSNPLY